MQSLSSVDHATPRPNRARLIAQLKQQPAAGSKRIDKRLADAPAPLSYAQERLWIAAQLEPGNPIYNVAGALCFNGALNIAALQQSLSEVVRRHEILRTRFAGEHRQIQQCVIAKSPLALSQVDLRGNPPASLQACTDAFIRLPFDLGIEAPLRGMLVVLDNEQHMLVLTLHHIAADRWSVAVLLKETAALYALFDAGLPSALPELPIQYGDFCVWQRQRPEQYEKHLRYWTQKLHGAPPLLELPGDYPRPPLQSYRGDLYAFTLEEPLAADIKALCKQYNATLFMVMAAAFNSLLHRYSGSSDISVGYPAAGRHHAQTADLIGFFVNTLVLRCRLADDLPFAALLSGIREQALQDQMHQDICFGQLVEALNPARDAGHAPLFQVMLAVQNVPAAIFRAPGLDAQQVALNNRASQFDLTLFIEERDGQLHGLFEYNTDLFAAETPARMAGHLQTLLTGAAAHPELPLARLPILTANERRQLLYEWNTPSGSPLVEHSRPLPLIHQLFEAQARAAPAKPAVVCAGQSISYGELDSRAERLADALRSRGIGAEHRVGVCAERSVELIAGLLAVLKAGASYVPLDPGYPDERLDYMLHDAGIDVLLTQAHLAGRFRQEDVAAILLERPEDAATRMRRGHSGKGSAARTTADNIAYVIYTSGSTGLPKGVLVSHRNLLHSTLARLNYYWEAPACFLLLSSFAFDSSVAGIFWTLTQGGRLCLPQQDELSDPFALAQLISRQQVSHLLALPSFYAALAGDAALPLLASLQAVIVAGEACPGEIAAEHHRRLPHVKFYNEYGPTEGTVWSSVWQNETPDAPATLPIGRPIGNVQIYILDRHHQPVPAGVAGELYIAGSGLARGYLHRPDLTAERFIPNPFGAPGSRLYKSGDVGRYRNDGCIEFLGRSDNQVKIRGYRIEPSEIESRLLQYPGVREAAVLAREERAGGKRLIAYVVAEDAPLPETQLLQSYLKQRLPDYMVPPVFIGLDKLPLTPNGKLDRKALPSPSVADLENGDWAPPRNAVERILAGIWAELLGIERIGIYDNFFHLGGDSILSIQAVSRARQAGLSLHPRQLFQYQTIAELAAVAVASGAADGVGAEQGRIAGELPLTPIQQWFFELDLAQPQHWNQALLLQAAQRLDAAVLQQAIEHVVGHHDALRLTFAPQAGGWKAVVQKQAAFALRRVDLDALAAEQRPQRIAAVCAEQQQTLDLTDGPLFTAVLFDSRQCGAQRLFWAIHHLLVDAVSWRILLDDLQTAYRQLANGQSAQLPPKTTSFKQWAEQLRIYAQSAALQQEADYWLSRQPAAPLPVDNPQGGNSEGAAASVTVALSEAETEALLQQVPSVYRTRINDMLLAALSRSLCEWSGSDSVYIDVESHGREQLFDSIDLSRTVGWFSSVAPLSLKLPADAAPASLIKSVKEQLRQVPGNGIGYFLLRYFGDAATRAALKNQPAAPVIFNYLGRLDSALPADSRYQVAPEDSGAARAGDNQRPHEIEVIAKVQQGVLQTTFNYSRRRYRSATIEALSHAFRHNLQNLIRHCRLPGAGAFTPADFPLTRLSQQELDDLALTPAHIDDVYPLTPLQQGLAFHSLYAQQAGVYCILLGCRLQGHIDVPAFKQAWQRTVERHAILRTGFLLKESDEPLQFVCRSVALPWSELDWRGLDDGQRERHWQDFQRAERQAGFDFAAPPLMRLTLIRCAPDEHYFAWSFHHLLQDGWSMALMLKDVFACYQALSTGRDYRLPGAKPYRDYVAWLQRQDMSAAETYWRNALAGFDTPTLLFPDSKAGAPAAVDAYSRQDRHFSTGATARLQSYAQNSSVTLNTLLQGAWAVLLSRYSGARDVLFGVTVSGRPAELDGIEHMTGLFINTLPLRIRAPDDAANTAWLQQLLQQNVMLRQYEYTPLVNIRGWSEIAAGQSLFDTLLVFENYPADRVLHEQIGNVTITDIAVNDQTHYPLTLTAVPGPQLEISLSYDRRYGNEAAMAAMLGHFTNILESLTDTARLAQLRLLSSAEERRQLVAWNATAAAYPHDGWIHQLFEAQAAAAPEAAAVLFGEDVISYAELNRRSNRLAHYLQSGGVGPDVPVGVCLERSPELVIALLAVLKAGGAYVPLDPGYPQERLDFMLRDAQTPLVLTHSALRERIAGGAARGVCLDELGPQLADAADTNPVVALQPEHLAYCIYTSGSTGRPKGAAIPHRGILNRLQWMQAAYRLDASDRVLQKTPFSFDVSVWEFFWPLMTGATLVVAAPEQHKDSRALIDLIRRRGVTTLHFVPSMLHAFLDTPGVSACTSLKRVMCSGEALPAEGVRRFYRQSAAELHNLYGPTEASVDVSYWACAPDTGDSVPIGRPIANTQLYILDRRLNLLPAGIAGELHIGGVGLARGYLNRAALTAEKFIPDPFGTAGGRLYKTGDLARYRSDGAIEYLGRLDHQVKIRGFRIELGEIEARLRQHPGIKDAAVVAREDAPGDKRLIAYLVAAAPDSIDDGELRAYLSAALPEYMLPSAFVRLEAMPLSANGKLERKDLPAPDRQAQSQTVYVAPRNDTETALAAIWSDLLAVEQVGVDDDFFALGGHSLTATQLVSRLNRSFQLDLSLRDVFAVTTIADLSLLVEERLIEKLEALSEDEADRLVIENPTVAV